MRGEGVIGVYWEKGEGEKGEGRREMATLSAILTKFC